MLVLRCFMNTPKISGNYVENVPFVNKKHCNNGLLRCFLKCFTKCVNHPPSSSF